MEKPKKVPLNRLVLPETFEKVKQLAVACDLTDGGVIDRAVRLFYGQREVAEESESDERLDEILELLRSLPDREGLREVFLATMDEYKARKATSSVVASTFPAPDRADDLVPPPSISGMLACHHCGVEGKISPKTPNPMKPCTECVRKGHQGFQPCPQCAADDHQKEMEAKHGEGVDYNVNWGA